jgi:glycosyltransferase involved in cell wall biosynthesis
LKVKKRILAFIDWYLPGYKAGGPVRSMANIVAHLKSDFDFYIVTSDTEYCEDKPYENVKSNEWNQLEEGVQVYYYSQDHFSKNNLKQLIETTPFDVAYLNGIFSYQYSILPLKLLKKQNAKRIVAVRGMLSEGALNVKSTKKSLFLTAAKLSGLYKGVTFQATNENEARDIKRKLSSSANVKVIPNLPSKPIGFSWSQRNKETGTVRLVSVARIAPEKNTKYALEVLQNCTQSIEFDLYGPAYDTAYWEDCKAVIAKLPSNVKVEYKGSKENDKVYELLKGYDVMFLPSTGENYGHIILESFAAGLPVIISDRTPWEGVKQRGVGETIALGKNDEYATAIDAYANMNSESYNQCSKAAFEYAKSIIEDAQLIEMNKQLFDEE